MIKHPVKSISCPLYKKPFKSDYFILEFFIGLLGILQEGESFRLLFGHLFHDLHGVFCRLSSLNTRKHCEARGHARQPREVNAQAALHRGHTGTGPPEVRTRWLRHEGLCSLPRPFLSKPITIGPSEPVPSERHWQSHSPSWLRLERNMQWRSRTIPLRGCIFLFITCTHSKLTILALLVQTGGLLKPLRIEVGNFSSKNKNYLRN